MQRFKVLDHTADIGLIVYGDSLNALFENAAKGFFHLITDLRKVKQRVPKHIAVEGQSLERLMVDWLTELLYFHDVENLLFKKFHVEFVGGEGLKATAIGEPFEEGHHIIKTEIKAITHHRISVRQENERWRAQIIFDL
jgi:SHS2 domain-containing protein